MFADTLVLALFRLLRRFFRCLQAKKWPTTTATITGWTCIDSDAEYRRVLASLQIQAVFEYIVAGEKFVGLLKSTGLDESSAWKYVDEAPKPAEIIVRYNPSDPGQSRVLDDDNALSFKVAIY